MGDDEFCAPGTEARPRPARPGMTLLLVLGLAVTGFGVYRLAQGPSTRGAVTATSGRLTLEKDDGGTLQAVSRRGRPEVWYRVTLAGAPAGTRLPLSCAWIDPAGAVAHRNRYTTRAIDRPAWPTHARHRLGPGAPTGTWTVKLSLDGRVLHEATFEVLD